MKNTYHHGDLCNALVLTAVHLIETDGLDEFSLRATAREVGVSANAAYRHFADKSDLLDAVAQHGFEQLGHRMRRAMSATRTGKNPAELAVNRFKATGRAYVAFALDRPELFEVMFGGSVAHPVTPRDPADDEAGTSVEFFPVGTEMVPAADAGMVEFRHLEGASPFGATHLTLSVDRTVEQVQELARSAGWRAEVVSRGPHDVIEFWVENAVMVEVMTPEMTAGFLAEVRPG